jgi:zinc/manganese transport system substrate-binding protein
MKTLAGILSLFLAFPVGGHAELKVASLSTITTDLAKNIGGDAIELIPIIKPGMDPHEFQPSPSDIKQIESADLVLLIGKGMEGYLTKLEKAVASKAKFVDIGSTIPSLKLQEEGRIIEDSHWWHSIENMKRATLIVKKQFIEADPANKELYAKNAAAYLTKLSDLQKWAKLEVAKLPAEKRKLVTSHEAFQYFAREFGFKIYAIEGVTSDDQPSSKKIADLIKTITREGVKAVFFENIENPKVIAEITRETTAKVGGQLYADGLGIKEASTYSDMMRYNITTIVNSLK